MDSMSPLQVCVSLIKRCLCASCLPSARFIIKVSKWGRGDQSSRFTNLWSCFHEWGGPLLQFLLNTQLSVCEGSVRGLCLLARCPVSVDSPCATPSTYHKLHFPSFFVSYAFPQVCTSHSFPIFHLPSPFSWMFLHRGEINHHAATPSSQIFHSVIEDLSDEEQIANMQLYT